jgi:serine-type D-Ala-D-Ala carboxypeptidase/endopeptidase (penicillin-binding protein 4)
MPEDSMTARRLTSATLAVIMLASVPAASHAAVSSPGVSPAPSPGLPLAPSPATSPDAVVLTPAAARAAAPPTAAGLEKALLPLLRSRDLGPRVGAAVVDAGTGAVLYARGGGAALTPASTTKLLTAAAVLQRPGPDARLVTRVVAPAASPPGTPAPGPADTVLVGGGDPTLTGLPRTARVLAGYPLESNLAVLAARAAQALRGEGVRQVRLGYDDTLFTGRATAASWSPDYVRGAVGPVSALSVDQGRVRRPGAARVGDPAREAARRFATLLARSGVVVAGPPARRVAPAPGRTLATVESAPVAALVEYLLLTSDNDVAEALARQAALASGSTASFDGAAQAVVGSVAGLGVDVRAIRLYDGSGLSRANRIPAVALAQLLRVAASAEHPELRPLVTGLPVAGFTGTLDTRFRRGPAAAGAGVVRAKTGTLRGVTSLAGVVPARTGPPLAYAFIADQLPVPRTLAARDTLDRLAGVLAACGCHQG